MPCQCLLDGLETDIRGHDHQRHPGQRAALVPVHHHRMMKEHLAGAGVDKIITMNILRLIRLHPAFLKGRELRTGSAFVPAALAKAEVEHPCTGQEIRGAAWLPDAADPTGHPATAPGSVRD